MSVSEISNGLSNSITSPAYGNRLAIQQQFEQLGEDLESGDLSDAQTETNALAGLLWQYTSPESPLTNNPVGQEISQLSQDIQATNVYAAEQDYTTLQEYLELPGAAWNFGGGMSPPTQLKESMNPLTQAVFSGGFTNNPQTFSFAWEARPQLQQNAGQNPTQISLPAGLNRFSVLA